jgi:hypothetical protein
MLYLDKDNKDKGLPEDREMASFNDPLVKIDQLLTPRPRTGTPTYLAIDLLKDNPPHHTYRHELESFFYVLLWTALHYDMVADVRHPTAKVVEKWEDEFGENIRLAKGNFCLLQ